MRLDANKFYAIGSAVTSASVCEPKKRNLACSFRAVARTPARAFPRQSDNMGQLSLTVRLPQLPTRPQSCNYEHFGRIS